MALFNFGPSGAALLKFWAISNSFIQCGSQPIQELQWNLDTIRNIWVHSNSLNTIWVIETASLKHGYSWNHLSKLEEVHSDLHIINMWVNSNRPNQNCFWANW